MDSHLEQGQEEQGQCLVNRSIDQSLGQEQEEPSEAHILAEESLHRRVEGERRGRGGGCLELLLQLL